MLEGYTNANMVGDIDSRMSTLGYLMTFAKGAISRQSKLQKYICCPLHYWSRVHFSNKNSKGVIVDEKVPIGTRLGAR